MDGEMRSDAELLDTLLNEATVVLDRVTKRNVILDAKVLAHWTDRSVQTISDYRGGNRNIPVDFWRLILTRTFDGRILRLILPDDHHCEVWAPDDVLADAPVEVFRQAVRAEGEHHEAMQYIAEMLADGRIDDLDESRVKRYDDAFIQHRRTDSLLHRAIIHKYNAAVAARRTT